MAKTHDYPAIVEWTGNTGKGTSDYQGYSRNHALSVEGKEVLELSSDVIFRGDGSKYNPEDLFVYTFSSCHMLWYLHLCADAGIVVTSYTDAAVGTLDLELGKFTAMQLRPRVSIADLSMKELAESLHAEAHKKCFIANSSNVPVTISVEIS